MLLVGGMGGCDEGRECCFDVGRCGKMWVRCGKMRGVWWEGWLCRQVAQKGFGDNLMGDDWYEL